jgi:trk system potassium uptake protein TrkH
VVVYKRTIPPGLIRKSSAIITVQFTVVLVITGLLMAASNANLTDALYEVMSAVNTVGLSRGLTGDLNVAGQIIIIIGMFLGRVGPITMLLFFKNNTRRADGIQYADGKYIVG